MSTSYPELIARNTVYDPNTMAYVAMTQPGTSTVSSTGQLADGVDDAIKATVKDYANANPLAVVLMNTSGDAYTAGGASGLTDAELRATPVPVSVSGVATAAKQDTGNTSLAAIDTKLASQATAAKQDTLQTAIDAIKTATEVIDNFISGARGLVTEDNSAAIKAKTDNLDVALSTRLKAADTLAAVTAVGTVTTVTTVSAVTAITNALPAGANAIGKLAANSGVDIGDVDVTSLPALVAGAALIGKVGIDQTTPGTTNKVSIGTDGIVSITKTDLTPSAPTVASVGVTTASAVAAAATRKGLILRNLSTAGQRISLGFGSAAVLDSGVTLYPQDAFCMGEYDFDVAAVNAISSAASGSLAIQEYLT